MASAGLRTGKEGKLLSTAPLVVSSGSRVYLLGLLLVLATVALYYPAVGHPFSNYDDDGYVRKNLHVQAGLGLPTVQWAFTTFTEANWHPLTWLSHAMDCQLFELNPGGHHATNIALQALNAVLLFWVFWRATGYTGRSFMVAALFALHPVNVESVAWIAERKNLLSMTFFLLALGAYRWYAGQPKVGRYSVVALLYACGLMAKPQIVTFPCVLLLWDYWPLRRMFASLPEQVSVAQDIAPLPPRKLSWLLLEKLPLLGLSMASAVITVLAQFGAGADAHFPKWMRLGNAVGAYALYIRNLFWPTRLALMYPHPGNFLRLREVVAALLLLAAVTALVVVQRRRRYLTVGWLWFLGTLVPMLGLVQVGTQAMADRYAYLPYIGLFVMLCWGIAELAEQRHIPVRWLAAGSAIVLLTTAAAARRQLDYWQDNITLWTHTLQITERNFTAEDNLGGALLDVGKLDEAAPHFYRALELWPSDSTANLNVGYYQQQRGDLTGAIEHYQVVVQKSNSTRIKSKAYMNMGYAYRDLGDYVQSRDDLQASLKLNPQNGEAWTYLGIAAQRCGDLSLAATAYSRGMELKPTDWGYVLLAQVLEESGHPDQAQAARQKGRRLTLDWDETQGKARRVLNQ